MPALWAAYTRHAELAAIRKPIDAYSGDGFTALGLAVFFGHEQIVVVAGADVNRPSRNAIRAAPLQSAVVSGSLALLDLLLQHGAHPDPVEFLSATPLHSAAARGSREMVERLLKEGKTAADLAQQYGHDELATWLANYSSPAGGSDGK